MEPFTGTTGNAVEGNNESDTPEALAEPISRSPSRSPFKHTRSFSDLNPRLSPSPQFKEPPPKSRDDNALLATPTRTPSRLHLFTKGLSLKMPPRDIASFNIAHLRGRGGFSSSVESRESGSSPATVLPRHSRGLDFSRACTNLHHFTLAESSPDSSPTITQKGISSRRASTHSMMLDSPVSTSGWTWASDRSVFMRNGGTEHTSDASESDSDEDMMRLDETEDAIVTTPQVKRDENANAVTPFGAPKATALGGWLQGPSAQASYAHFHQHRLGRGRSRKSSSSGSAVASPIPSSPIMTNASDNHVGGYFPHDGVTKTPISRRESLSLGTNSLHISTSNESGDENGSVAAPVTPGVVRRPVTRRSNLLPKTKVFARIRAALQEESSPADSEAKREAEIVHHVRGSDESETLRSNTTPFSPRIPSVARMPSNASAMSEDPLGLFSAIEAKEKQPEESIAADSRRESGNWSNGRRMQTPPPPIFRRNRSSSGVSADDWGVDSLGASTPPSSVFSRNSATQPIDVPKKTALDSLPTSNASYLPPGVPSSDEVPRKASNKRCRDEDFDPSSIKRRAVSPSMGGSVQGSPVMGQSPREQGVWANAQQPRKTSHGSEAAREPAQKATTPQATPKLGPKRVGLQGMTDTSDGLMNMSIE